MTSAGTLPAAGLSAVVMNVTVTQPGAGGYITAWADGQAQPTASNLNFVSGETVPNLVVAPVGSDGRVNLFDGSTAATHLLADVAGYFIGTPIPSWVPGTPPPLPADAGASLNSGYIVLSCPAAGPPSPEATIRRPTA